MKYQLQKYKFNNYTEEKVWVQENQWLQHWAISPLSLTIASDDFVDRNTVV